MTTPLIYIVKAAAVKVRIGDRGDVGVARIIRRGGIVPAEVSEDQVKHLVRKGFIEKMTSAEPRPVDKMTVEELKAYASKRSIDLGEATKKDEILAAVQAAAEPASEGE